MSWKRYRLRKHWYFQDISQRGEKMVRNSFFVRLLSITSLYQKRKDKKIPNNCLFGISISKSILKKAVQRNVCKREIKTMLIQHLRIFENSCGTGKNHPHLAFIISIRPGYLENSSLLNKEILYKLLFFVYNKRGEVVGEKKNGFFSYKKG